MNFGVHFQIGCSSSQSPAQRYRESLEQAIHAESLGFESVWPVEQHFNQRVSVMPAPMLFLAALAGRTSRIRLGTAITILPFNHPVRVAEELATLDVLSGGRVEFGFGRGAVPAHFERFGVPMAESRERMLESLSIVEGLIAQSQWSYAGNYFQLNAVTLTPRPLQQPFPTPRAAANSLETFELMGQLGYPIFAASHINPFPRLPQMIAAYRTAFARANHPPEKSCSVDLLCPVFVGESLAEVEASISDSLDNFKQIALDEVAPLLNDLSISSLRERVAYLQGMCFEQVNRDMGIFGDAPTCVARIQALRAQFDIDRLICWFDPGGLVPHAKVMQSMALFARDVMPHFADTAAL